MKSELYLDNDGYPADLALTLIEVANPFEKNPHHLMDFVKGLWQYSDWGWSEKKKKTLDGKKAILYSISTGGWSGNESLITALKNNKNFFWALYWKESRVGGHYKFLIPKRFIGKEKTEAKPHEVVSLPQNEEKISPNNSSATAYATCLVCGQEMRHNTPKLGDAGGFVHKDTDKFECSVPQPTKFIEQSEPIVKPTKLNFRVWDTLNKTFIYFEIQDYPSGVYGGVSHPQQSTGIIDKNNKEIFEGDILCFYPNETDIHGTQIGPALGEVYFKDACFYFTNLPLNEYIVDEIFSSQNTTYLENIEVIGNTFENPELLNQ